MRYAYIIIAVIVLLILVGVGFAFMRNGTNSIAGTYPGAPYQASMAGTAYGNNQVVGANTNCPNPCQPVQQVQQTYSYPVVYPVASYANTTACPYNATTASIWHTSPAITPGYYGSSYNIPGSTNTTVYPGGVNQVYPGSSQSYQYQVPGYSGSNSYYPATQTQYPQYSQYQQYPQGNVQVGATAGGGSWFR